MADFTTFTLEANTNTNASPTWTNILGAARELRFHDTSTAGLTTTSAAWPYVTRSAVTAGIDYAYAYTADAVGIGVIGSGAAPTAYSNANYLQFRWNWDNVGTFASAPIWTAYHTTAHAAISRGDGSLLGGHATDTGGTARSYLKGNAWGDDTAAMPAAPTGAPSNVPAVTDGTTGALTYTGAAAWLTNYQSLQGDNDYIQYGATPSAVTAAVWYGEMRLFMGPNMTPGTLVPVVSLKYTYA